MKTGTAAARGPDSGGGRVAAEGSEDRVLYSVRTGLWERGRAVLLDGGHFSEPRIADVAALVSQVAVVDDRGTADSLRRAGVPDVVAVEGTSIGDAIRVAAEMPTPVVLTASPKRPGRTLDEAVAAITAESPSLHPLAAVMVMRPAPASTGALCAVAENSFVSGYGARVATALAGKTAREIRVVAPQHQRLRSNHDRVVGTALQLADHAGTRLGCGHRRTNHRRGRPGGGCRSIGQ